jgi:hypothetical protein
MGSETKGARRVMNISEAEIIDKVSGTLVDCLMSEMRPFVEVAEIRLVISILLTFNIHIIKSMATIYDKSPIKATETFCAQMKKGMDSACQYRETNKIYI